MLPALKNLRFAYLTVSQPCFMEIFRLLVSWLEKEGAGFRTMLMKILALNSLSALVQKKQFFRP